MLAAAEAPATTPKPPLEMTAGVIMASGLGGAINIGVVMLNLLRSGCIKLPIDKVAPPLNGWPTTKLGCAWSVVGIQITTKNKELTCNPLEHSEPGSCHG